MGCRLRGHNGHRRCTHLIQYLHRSFKQLGCALEGVVETCIPYVLQMISRPLDEARWRNLRQQDASPSQILHMSYK